MPATHCAPTTTFPRAYNEAFDAFNYKLAVGGSMTCLGGKSFCHHINALMRIGTRVCRTSSIQRAATVAAHNRQHLVSLAAVEPGQFEVWAVRV